MVQFRRADPLERRAAEQPRFAAFQPADKKLQVNGFLRVGVGDGFKKFADGDLHAEFLADFARQALLEGFARFALATGEFPQPAEMGIGVAPGDEQFAAAKNQGGGNFRDAFGIGCRGSGVRRSGVRLSSLDFRLPFHRPTLL